MRVKLPSLLYLEAEDALLSCSSLSFSSLKIYLGLDIGTRTDESDSLPDSLPSEILSFTTLLQLKLFVTIAAIVTIVI
jgi:hypothetical protein